MNNFPCWLSPKDRQIGRDLINKADFIYCGHDRELNFYDQETETGYKLGKCQGWQIASAYGELAIEIKKNGAVFGKSLEFLPDLDFEKEVALAKKIICQAAREWNDRQPTQLCLF